MLGIELPADRELNVRCDGNAEPVLGPGLPRRLGTALAEPLFESVEARDSRRWRR
jgi:hypothetical protein